MTNGLIGMIKLLEKWRLSKMAISFDEWITNQNDLQTPLMLPNSDFIQKLSQDEWEDLLQLIFLKVQENNETLKNKIVTIIENSYINERSSNDIKNIIEIRDYIKNNL